MLRKTYRYEGLGVVHQEVLQLVRPGTRVLEVGCATGCMTRALQENLDCEVHAVEPNPEDAAQAAPFASQMTVGDIGDPQVREAVGRGYDAVIFADVLEHLVDPWETVRWVRTILCPGGCVAASVPNVAHYTVRLGLLRGRFDYAPYGLLDDTHLRFFTERSLRALFVDNGYAIQVLKRVFLYNKHRRFARFAPNTFTHQFVLQAMPAGTSGSLSA